MHSFKKFSKAVLVIAVCTAILILLDTALYPCTFMRNDVHTVVTQQFDDIILGTSHGKMDIDPESMEEVNGRTGHNLCVGGEYGIDAYYLTKLITEKQKVPYVYENTPESLAEMGKIINVFIDNLPIKREEILEVCVNVAERVRPLEGRAYNMFNFLEESLAEKLTELLELPTCIENDSRSMTYGEFVKGCCKGKKDVIFVNVCWGLGIGIIIDGKLYYGKSGYSGEFGHMTAYNNNIICHCGKIGCVETEVSGRALKRKLMENILAGKPSILSDKVLKQKEELTLEDIMDAIAKEDVVSLATLQHIADELGKQLAGIINIFNPDMLVIGGEMSVTGDYLTLPVNMGIKKYSLNIMNEDSQIVTSELKDQAGVIGACLIARQKLLTI